MFQISDFVMNEEFHDCFPPGLKGPGLLLSLHENGRDLMRSLDSRFRTLICLDSFRIFWLM